MGVIGTGLSGSRANGGPITLQEHHRSMARAYAVGATRPTALAQAFGLSVSQTSKIVQSPLFQAEVRRLRSEAETVSMADHRERLEALTPLALAGLCDELSLGHGSLNEGHDAHHQGDFDDDSKVTSLDPRDRSIRQKAYMTVLDRLPGAAKVTETRSVNATFDFTDPKFREEVQRRKAAAEEDFAKLEAPEAEVVEEAENE